MIFKKINHKKKFLEIYGLENLPARINPERLDELVTILRTEKTFELKEVIKEIALGHLRLGAAIAASYNINYEGAEDLFGEAQLAIIEAIKLARNALYDNNITPYITVKIHSHIKNFIGQNNSYGIPPRTIRYWHETNDEKGRYIPSRVALVAEDFSDEKIDDSGQNVRTKRTSIFVVVPQMMEDHKELEIKEILDAVVYDFVEKRIIELKMEGYTHEQVGKEVGYSKGRISEILKKIEERFFFKYGKPG